MGCGILSERADNRLVELGLAKSRERARALIMEGVVFVDGVRVVKPGDTVREGQVMTLKEDPIPFVSRGGLKLEKAVAAYDISLENRVCVDVGASTGGFTDCMLKRGARLVYAVDVGYGQLDWGLRNDPRVVCMERHNARLMEKNWFSASDMPSFASVDVSFISIKLILPRLIEVLKGDSERPCEAVVLVKPQFEAGRGRVGKNGVVREKSTHLEVLSAAAKLAMETGFLVCGVDFSPITGPKGNIEFLLYLSGGAGENSAALDGAELENAVCEAVNSAHSRLG